LLAAPALAGLSISIGSTEHPALTVTDLRLEIGPRTAVMTAARFRLLGREHAGLRVECAQFAYSADKLECSHGYLAARDLAGRLPFSFSRNGKAIALEIRPAADERWSLNGDTAGDFKLEIAGGRGERLQSWLPLPDDWKIAGRLDGRLKLARTGASGRLTLSGGSFSNSQGSHAGEQLATTIDFQARQQAKAWHWESRVHWQQGEVFIQPVYAKADGQQLTAKGRFDASRLSIDETRLVLPGIGEISGALQWNRRAARIESARLESAGLDLSRGGSAYLMPILAQFAVPETKFGGRLSFSLLWDQAGLATVGVGLDDLSLQAADGRFSATGIRGGLPWQRTGVMEGYLAVDAAQVADFRLGSFNLPITVEPQRFSIRQAEIPFLDSKLQIERLVWRKSTKRQAWEGDLGLSLPPVSLPDLTKALGLPVMSGQVSAAFPRLRYREGAAYLDGSLQIRVFEGDIQFLHLRLEDPFGSTPRLTADVVASRINLGQLTDTFSFGRITGYADAEIKGLELVGWKPVKFDARVSSSPGNYPKRISQRAVQNISSLGGAGAGAANQASFLRFFETFGYENIGLSCQLRGGICTMGGVEDVPAGYVIVKGGGLPALSVIGYNRQVNWPELVDRLHGIIRNNVKPVIQ